MNEEKTISYFYNKDTKTYTISDKEMQKINRKLKERFTLKQENKQLKLDYELYKDNCVYRNYEVETKDITIKQLKEVIEEVRETLINSKEYKMANAMNLNAKQSVLVELLQILDKGVKVDN